MSVFEHVNIMFNVISTYKFHLLAVLLTIPTFTCILNGKLPPPVGYVLHAVFPAGCVPVKLHAMLHGLAVTYRVLADRVSSRLAANFKTVAP